MNIQEKWMSTSFAQQKGDAKETLYNLAIEMEDLLKQEDKLKEINAKILSLKSSTESWKDPANFDSLYATLHANVDYIKGNINFNKNEPAVLQIVKAKQMADLVDAMDLTLKSLGTSGQYEDKVKQAERFQEVLKDFYDVLEIWSVGVGDKAAREAILDKAKTFFAKEYVIGAKDLSLSGRFNVATANINARINGAFGWERILGPCITLQDAFTLIHQNLINVISGLSRNVSLLIKSELPNEVNTIIDTVANFGFRSSSVSSLLYSEVDNGKVALKYNLPLANHSAMFNLVYDSNTKRTTLEFLAFGDNHGGRWILAEEALNYDLERNLGVNLVERASYNHNTKSLSFTLDLSGLQPQKLKQILLSIDENCIQVSFGSYQRAYRILHQSLQYMFELLTSYNAKNAYSAGVRVSELKDLEIEKVRALISNNALYVYLAGIRISELKDLEIEKINALISDNAPNAYRAGIKVSDLKDLDTDKIKVLISNNAVNAYLAGIKISDLKDLEIEKINALISDNAPDAYRAGVKVSDLKDLDTDRINELVSYRATVVYSMGLKVSDLKDLDLDKLWTLLSGIAIEAYHTGKITVKDVKDLDTDTIKLLTSKKALEIYKEWDRKAHEFDKLSAKDTILIQRLSDNIGKELFKEGATDDRKEDVERIRLTLSEAINNIKRYNPNFEVAHLDAGKLNRGLRNTTGVGLSGMFYKCCSYTKAGLVTGGIYLPEQNLTDSFKKQLAGYIMKSPLSKQRAGRISFRDRIARSSKKNIELDRGTGGLESKQ
jgi:hypothetical protein